MLRGTADTSHQGDGGRGETGSVHQPNLNAGGEQGQEGKGKYRIKVSAKTRMGADMAGRQKHFCILSLSLSLTHTYTH